MKKSSLYLLWATLGLTIAFNACKKDNKQQEAVPSETELKIQSDDHVQVSSETDDISNDVTILLNSNNYLTGANVKPVVRGGVIVNTPYVSTEGICGAEAEPDNDEDSSRIVVTYDGDNCRGDITRTGTIVISWKANAQWKDQGAKVVVSIRNLKSTRKSDNKSVTLNGTHTYTNVSGGSFGDLIEGSINSITHTVTSDDMSILFDNGEKRTWHIARQRVYTANDYQAMITTTGLHTEGNTSGISEWGTNRLGNEFTAQITTPLVIDGNCSYRLTKGEVKLVRPIVTTTITFGLDDKGAPVTSCPEGSYYFKLVYQAGKTYTFILPY